MPSEKLWYDWIYQPLRWYVISIANIYIVIQKVPCVFIINLVWLFIDIVITKGSYKPLLTFIYESNKLTNVSFYHDPDIFMHNVHINIDVLCLHKYTQLKNMCSIDLFIELVYLPINSYANMYGNGTPTRPGLLNIYFHINKLYIAMINSLKTMITPHRYCKTYLLTSKW